MRRAAWLAWHTIRIHVISIGRPYDAPVGVVARCRCGDRKHLY